MLAEDCEGLVFALTLDGQASSFARSPNEPGWQISDGFFSVRSFLLRKRLERKGMVWVEH
jgi:hypothetical protein